MNDLRITVNGEPRAAAPGTTVAALLARWASTPRAWPSSATRTSSPRKTWSDATLADGDKLEIVAFVGGGSARPRCGAGSSEDPLVIGGRTSTSRLLVGTGKYRTLDEGREAIRRSGAEIVTVALRRVDLTPGKPNVLDTIDRKRHTILPNTAGCYTADEAVRTCRLARELGIGRHGEARGDRRPADAVPRRRGDARGRARSWSRRASRCSPTAWTIPSLARKLEDVGCAAVMPLAAPIGSGLGIRNPYNIRIILEQAKVPVIVDAGVGTASDAAVAMELGCDGVLMNTAIAGARDPSPHGRGHARRRRRGPQGVPRRAHPAQALRDRVVARSSGLIE